MHHIDGLTVTPLDETRFRGMADEWDELIARSAADPLFLGWAWQWTWWETWSRELGAELFLLSAVDESGKLVGLAPLYRRRRKGKDGRPRVRLELIGNCRGIGTVRSEYMTFVCDRENQDRVIDAFLTYLASEPGWQEWLISDIQVGSALWRKLVDERSLAPGYLREISRDRSWFVDLKGDFASYLNSIGRNTRLKFYNRRDYVAKLGKLEYEYYSGPELDRFFDDLNHLHSIRWGGQCFTGGAVAFHRNLAERMVEQGGLAFSAIRFDGRTISTLYDLRVGGTEYNIQAGFDENFDKKVSLGLMHLGYAIESAFGDGMNCFNMLGGQGMRTPYKGRLTDTTDELATIQIVRDLSHKMIYRFTDTVTIPLKNKVKTIRSRLLESGSASEQ